MQNVKLSDFIENTLVDIAVGVNGANKKVKETLKNGAGHFCLRTNIGDSSRIPGVSFDVAVTATKKSQEGAGFMVALLNLGGGAQTEKSNVGELAHRIKFEVGIQYNFD